MELKGQNLATFKKQHSKNFSELMGIEILMQIIESIKGVHDAGLIHRDIKPVIILFIYHSIQSNFVMGCNTHEDKNKVYLVDFGLAKEHLDPITGRPMEA